MTTYVLTYRKNTSSKSVFGIEPSNESAKSVFQHELVQEVQRKLFALQKDPKYRNGKFEIRTLEGFKAKNILKE
jgi:hypothetical protein